MYEIFASLRCRFTLTVMSTKGINFRLRLLNVTVGGVPYPLLTNSELYKVLKTGCRMERPEMCCDEV